MEKKRKLSKISDKADDLAETTPSNASLKALPKTQLNYNFEIRCAGHTWVVHRANLCTKSKFFKALCDGPFEEGLNAVAELRDEDPKLVERMLQAISTPQYLAAPAQYRPENDLIEDARLYAIADKYDIPSLRVACADAFKELLNNVGTRKSPMLFIGELLPLLYEMTPTTDRVLRDTFEAFVLDTTQRSKLLPRQDIYNFAMENEQFGAFIMKANLQYWQAEGHFWCTKCERYQTPHLVKNKPHCGQYGICFTENFRVDKR